MMLKSKYLNLLLVIPISFTFLLTGCQENASTEKSVSIKPSVVLEEKKISGLDPNTEIYLRHKSKANAKPTSDQVVLFLEPFSVPTAKAFDVEGYSWMGDFANRGYDTWAMDFRGFGESTRPKEMNASPMQNQPVVSHQDALQDLTVVVDYIKKTRNVDRIHIVGWSYGAVVAGEYATQKPENINKLVLHGFMHGFNLETMTKPLESKGKPGEFNSKAPAYQVMEFNKAMHHWHMMLNGKSLVTDEAMSQVQKVFEESDEMSLKNENKSIRRPMGPLKDLYSIWSNRPIYNLTNITSPVLVIYGDLDFFAEKNVLAKLTGTTKKKEVVIPEATHWVLYEKNRNQLLDETDQFLKQN